MSGATRWWGWWRGRPRAQMRDPLSDRWYATPQGWIDQLSAAGIATTPALALNLSAIWRGLRVYGDQLGSLPCHVYERLDDGGRRRAPEHPLYDRLRWQPNREQTAMEFFETVIAHVLLWSHAYVEIVWDARGRLMELLPRHPGRMRIVAGDDGERTYVYTDARGTAHLLTADRVMHVRGFAADDHAPALTTYAAQSLATAAATERYAGRFFSRGVTAGLAIVHPHTLGEDGLRNLRDSARRYATGESAGILPLEEDVRVHVLGIDPEKAQMLASREFAIAEIARWLNLPPYVLGDTKSATYASAYEFRRDLVDLSLRPMAVRLEQAIQRDLIDDRQRYYAEFLFDSIARADLSARADYYARATGGAAWMTVNEVRERENLDPADEGDRLRQPLNTAPVAAAARARALAQAAAGRIVRRELAGLRGLGAPLERAALDRIYDPMVTLLAEHLAIPVEAARRYVRVRRAIVETAGVPAAIQSAVTAERQLVALALGEDEDHVSTTPGVRHADAVGD